MQNLVKIGKELRT